MEIGRRITLRSDLDLRGLGDNQLGSSGFPFQSVVGLLVPSRFRQ